MAGVRVSSRLEIPESELELTYVRSSGPGGQNVNKVNSKAVLRWNLVLSPSVPDELKLRLLERIGARLTRMGEVLIASDRFRDQGRNREDCLEKLRSMLARALIVEAPRKATRPSRSSQRKRREHKRIHGEKKAARRKLRDE